MLECSVPSIAFFQKSALNLSMRTVKNLFLDFFYPIATLHESVVDDACFAILLFHH